MMNTDAISRKRKRVVPAPAPSSPRLRSAILNVECAEDEDVEWQWTETIEGRFVSGYRIVSHSPGVGAATEPASRPPSMLNSEPVM
jgi:hypothetical protein